jgi:hypothetical protein
MGQDLYVCINREESGEMTVKWTILCGIVLIAAGSAPGGLTTYQEWTFDDADNPAYAEVDNNPYGDPTAAITVAGVSCGANPGWYPIFLGRSGVWASALTTVTLTIPNGPATGPNTYKDIRLEMEYRTILLEDTVIVANIPNLIVDKLAETITPTIDQYGYEDGWYQLSVHWRIYPNPLEEIVFLSVEDSGADIDSIRVYTECVPEPASLFLLIAGAAVAICKKRK